MPCRLSRAWRRRGNDAPVCRSSSLIHLLDIRYQVPVQVACDLRCIGLHHGYMIPGTCLHAYMRARDGWDYQVQILSEQLDHLPPPGDVFRNTDMQSR